MKKVMMPLLMGLVIGFCMMFLVQCGCEESSSGLPASGVKSAVNNSFDEVAARLNGGGQFYLYVSTERLIEAVEKFMDRVRGVMAQKMTKPSQKEDLAVFDFIWGLVKRSGLTEISGIGVSSVAIEENLNHSRLVFHHYKDKGQGFGWKLSAPVPEEMAALKMLPADTVWARSWDLRPAVFWDWFKKEAQASGIEELQQGVMAAGPMLQKQGIDLDRLLGGFTGKMWSFITFDGTDVRKIPMGRGDSVLELPDPTIVVVMEVADDYLFNLLESQMPRAQKSEVAGGRQLGFPAPPAPITLKPAIYQKDGFFVFTTNSDVIGEMWGVKEKGGGLVGTEEFKRLSLHVPVKGNGFQFLSSRFFRALMGVQLRVLAAEADKEARGLVSAFMELLPEEVAFYGVTENGPEGVVITMNHSIGFEGLVMLPAVAATGIVAAIAIPNFMVSRSKGHQKSTMGDMVAISTAIGAYVVDNGQAPVGTSLAEIEGQLVPSYIKVLPKQDAWGFDFHYYHGSGAKKDKFGIATGGSDGVFHGWGQKGYYFVTEHSGFARDIILKDGAFVYSPKVK